MGDRRELPTLSQVLSCVDVPSDCRCLYLSGSLVAGWGHATSDLDVYVISAGPVSPPVVTAYTYVDMEPPEVPVCVHHVDGRRWDVEYWTDGHVDQLLGRIEEGRVPLDGLVDFLYRITVGVPLMGDAWLEERRAQIARSRLRPMLVETCFDRADGLIEDAVGMLEVGDHASAVIAARQAFAEAVRGLLAVRERYAPQPKWRARQFQLARPTEMSWDEYWRLETMQGFDPEHPERWVEQVLEKCRSLMMAVDITQS